MESVLIGRCVQQSNSTYHNTALDLLNSAYSGLILQANRYIGVSLLHAALFTLCGRWNVLRGVARRSFYLSLKFNQKDRDKERIS